MYSSPWLVAELWQKAIKITTHNTTQHTNTNKLHSMRIVLVGFLPNSHGRSCGAHPFGCGYAFIECAENSMGRLVHLRLVEQTNLAVYEVREDGSDGCRICFMAREYAIGENAQRLDGLLLRVTEVFLPDSPNRSMRQLYRCNRGYAYAETVDEIL
jgi:hypothetical protein